MKILTKNHKYELANFENPDAPGQVLQFIEKGPTPEGVPSGLLTINNGTTNEEVLTMLIDRLNGLDKKMPSPYNKAAIGYCKDALQALERRTVDRRRREVEGTANP
jgi:hypothetical protein